MAAHTSAEHWRQIYADKREEELSWFEPSADVSLELLLEPELARDAPILDVGAGTSRLVDALLDRGFSQLSVLDIATSAIELSEKRLAERADRVRWISADITGWKPDRAYHAWHDRAVFHFLTAENDRQAYRRTIEEAVVPGGTVVIGTFACDGPERCSGLPVQRYSPESLSAALGSRFRFSASRQVEHITPAGHVQRFQFSRFIRA